MKRFYLMITFTLIILFGIITYFAFIQDSITTPKNINDLFENEITIISQENDKKTK